MKKLQPWHWLLIIFGVIILIVVLVILLRPKQISQPPNTPLQPTPPTGGAGNIWSILSGILGGLLPGIGGGSGATGGGTGKPCEPGYVDSIYGPCDCFNGCASSHPGYDCAGNPSTYC